MDEKKEIIDEMKEEVNEAKKIEQDLGGKPNWAIRGLEVLLGIALLAWIGKKIAGKVKEWNAARKEKKELKQQRKDAKKNPDQYVTTDDIPIDDSDSTEEK